MRFGNDNLLISLGGLLFWDVGYKEPDMLGEDESQDYTLMQYTGLKDKNGVEIYEGDIVRRHLNVAKTYDAESGYEERDYRHPELVPFIGVVKLRYNGWRLDCRKPIQKLDGHGVIRAASLAFSKAHSEVIGNIWEHSGLVGD